MTEEKTEQELWRMSWGLPAPVGSAAHWGARAILNKWSTKKYINAKFKNGKRTRDGYWDYDFHCALDLLPDRQSSRGEAEAKTELFAWLDKVALPEVNRVLESGKTKLTDGTSREIYELNDGEFHLRATPNGSYGYIYLGAWKEGETPCEKMNAEPKS